MKIKVIILISIVNSALVLGQTFGIGAVIGTNNGINLTIPKNENRQIDFILSYDFAKNNKISLISDYMLKSKDLKINEIPLWYGPQLKISFSNESYIGVQGKAQINYEIEKLYNIQTFGSVATGILIIPNTNPIIDINIGFKYFFDLNI